MRLTSKGQVTIPQDIRERLGLLPGTAVVFDTVGDSVRIRKAERQGRGQALIQRMRSVAGRAPRPRLTTDEIMALTRGD
jgi:AbrB family looped-hinge helix DNA binding protein